MSRKKTKKTRRQIQANLPEPEPIAAQASVAKPAEPETPAAKATEGPAPQPRPTGIFTQLKCTDTPPEGFYGGKFVRNEFVGVIAGKPFMRR